MLALVITLSLAVHVAAGAVALCAGLVAVFARKGAALHRVSGTVFVVSMLIMAVLAAYLAVVLPAEIPNLLIATLTIYLMATAWLTVQRRQPAIVLADRIALVSILCLFAPFAILSFQLAAGLQPFLKSSVALVGPVRVAIFSFTFIIACAAIGDARMLMRGRIAGLPRIARHLWRMCLGLAFAAGSAFTNGLPRLLPDSIHVPLLLLFVPQLSCLGLLLFWLVRVHLPGWYRTLAARPL